MKWVIRSLLPGVCILFPSFVVAATLPIPSVVGICQCSKRITTRVWSDFQNWLVWTCPSLEECRGHKDECRNWCDMVGQELGGTHRPTRRNFACLANLLPLVVLFPNHTITPTSGHRSIVRPGYFKWMELPHFVAVAREKTAIDPIYFVPGRRPMTIEEKVVMGAIGVPAVVFGGAGIIGVLTRWGWMAGVAARSRLPAFTH